MKCERVTKRLETMCGKNDDGFCCYGNELIITITTDDYPDETSWQLTDQNGVIVDEINQGFMNSGQSTYSWNVCVENSGCYDFSIYDGLHLLFHVWKSIKI